MGAAVKEYTKQEVGPHVHLAGYPSLNNCPMISIPWLIPLGQRSATARLPGTKTSAKCLHE
eukprot:687535-Pelagomonas_calceolata.AAC.1